MQVRVFPSVLSADFSCLEHELEPLRQAGCEQFHLDVMDGHFVPNISLGVPVVQSLDNALEELDWDVHLMIEEPLRYLDPFLQAGADSISVHAEVEPDLKSIETQARDNGAEVGLALNPDTSVDPWLDSLESLDYAVVMGVQPGFGGQSFQPSVLKKIERIRNQFPKLDIQVDGGVSPETAPQIVEHGGNWLVAGSAVFGAGKPTSAYRDLRTAGA